MMRGLEYAAPVLGILLTILTIAIIAEARL